MNQNQTICANCLHKTSNDVNNLICLVTGKTVDPGGSCENFAQSKRDSKEIAQFGYEAEKDYFSTKLYNLFAAYLIGIILGGVFLFIGYSTNPQEHVVMIVVSVLVILISAILSMVLLYNIWSFIINELGKNGLKPSVETPGKAVGYLFIPFFNFYWVFMGIGKLPVDLNRIAVARTGKRVIANELGIIIGITTLLSIIPVIGVLIALVNMVLTPAFFIMAINGIKNIPYSEGMERIEQKAEAEPLDINAISDFSQLFNKKQYGINYWFGLYYFGAAVCTQLILNVFYFITNKISLLQYFSIANIFNLIFYPLLFSLVLVLLSHAVRKKILLAFLWGLVSVLIGTVPFFIMMMRDYDYFYQYLFSKTYLIQVLTNFLSGVLFIISISIFIRVYGLKLWSILLSIAIPSLLTNVGFYTVSYLLEGKLDFKMTGLVGITAHIVLFAIGVYFGLYRYVQGTKRLVHTE